MYASLLYTIVKLLFQASIDQLQGIIFGRIKLALNIYQVSGFGPRLGWMNTGKVGAGGEPVFMMAFATRGRWVWVGFRAGRRARSYSHVNQIPKILRCNNGCKSNDQWFYEKNAWNCPIINTHARTRTDIHRDVQRYTQNMPFKFNSKMFKLTLQMYLSFLTECNSATG